jgi:cell division protein FtsI (penicillin-binding protein 3)
VAGKTGTTRLVDPETRRYSREKYASSFVGFVPADNPRVALIVVIFEPKKQYYGGQVAAPVFRKIAEETLAYLDVPREDSFRENVLRVKGVRYH